MEYGKQFSSKLSGCEDIKPPVTQVGVVGWIRANLFKGWLNSILTLITIYFLWIIVPPLIRWAFIDSLWLSSGAQCQQIDGACWSIIPANIRFITFGFFPYEQQWRPFVAMVLLIALLFYSRNRNHWKKHLVYAWILGLCLMGLLMKGGIIRPDPCGKYPVGRASADAFAVCFRLDRCLSFRGYTGSWAPIQNAGGKNTVRHVY